MLRKIMKKRDHHIIDLIKGGGINFIFYGLNLIIVYLLAIFISKYYGAAVYGRYSIIKSIILILIIITTLGLNTLAIKLASDSKHFINKRFKTNFLKKSYQVLFVSLTIIAALVFFLREKIALNVFNDPNLEQYFFIFPFLLVAAVFLNYNSNLFKGQGRVLLFSIVSSFLNNMIFFCFIFAVFNWYSDDELYLILGFLFSLIIALIVSLFKIFPLKYESPVKNISIKKLITLSYPMMLSSSMIYLIFSIDTLMLGFFEISENVGIYRIITQVSSISTIFLIVFGTIIGPKISNLYSDGKHEELKGLIKKSSKLIFFVTLPVFLLVVLFSKQILLFFGPEYLKGYFALVFLTFCQFTYAISGFVDLILNMTGRQKIFGKITIVCAVVNLLLNFLLIPKFGIIGAALSTGFSILLTNVIALVYIKKKMDILSIYIPFFKK